MNHSEKLSAYRAQISPYEFKRISEFVQTNFGIKLPDHKRIMVQGRLHKRLAALKMTNFSLYVHYLFSPEGMTQEIPVMVDLISTNKTNFFREAAHFNTLTDLVLKEFAATKTMNTLKIWSAGCSSGEEVYTLAMVVNEFMESHLKFNYKIWGTDISGRMLEKASKAIYDMKDVENIPLFLKKKYLLKHKNKEIKKIRVVPSLRKKTDFSYLNFMDDDYKITQIFDVIFCRNVLIYFEKNIQEAVLLKILKNLKLGGYLFLGHSESINDMNLPLKKLTPTVFQKIKL